MARDFDGSNDRISIGDIAIDAATMLGVSMWVNLDTLVGFDSFFTKRGVDATRIECQLGSGASYGGTNDVLVVIGTGDIGHTTSNIITTGDWKHLFIYFDGGGAANADRLKIFHNGVEQTLTFVGTIPAALGTNTAAFVIFARTDGTTAMDGRCAEFAIWTGLPGGVSAAQAAAILANGFSPQFLRKNGLHYYPLLGRTSPEIDLWGGGAPAP